MYTLFVQRNCPLFIFCPLVLWDRSLNIEPLARLHVVHVAGHGTLLVLLDDEVDGALLVDIADGCVGSDDGLLHVRALVLGDDSSCTSVSANQHEAQSRRTGDRQAALHVLLRQLKSELLGVVVYNLRLFQQQRHKALLAAGEGLLCGSAGLCGDLLRLF
jgi:hypothetical protein